MLDSDRDAAYNIVLSIFLGIIIVIFAHYMHDSPRTLVLTSDRKEPFDHTCS